MAQKAVVEPPQQDDSARSAEENALVLKRQEALEGYDAARSAMGMTE